MVIITFYNTDPCAAKGNHTFRSRPETYKLYFQTHWWAIMKNWFTPVQTGNKMMTRTLTTAIKTHTKEKHIKCLSREYCCYLLVQLSKNSRIKLLSSVLQIERMYEELSLISNMTSTVRNWALRNLWF